MKLSMYMLEHWLSDQVSSAIIRSGKRTITNARLFADEPVWEEDCLYVGRTRDFFPSSSSDEVMLMNGNDIVSVISTDINAIFNRVLSAFDYYNDLEHQMYSAIFKPNPEQAVLTICQHLLGPTFVLSVDYQVLAYSQNFNESYVNSFWTEFVVNREASPTIVRKMQRSVTNGLTKKNPDMIYFTEPNAAPYCHGLMSTYYGSSHRVIGHYITSDTCRISPFKTHISGIVLDFFRLIQTAALRSPQLDRYNTADDVLLSRLISGEDVRRSGEYLTVIHTLTEKTHYCVAAMETKHPDTLPVLQKALVKRFPCCICSRMEHQMVVLLWAEKPQALVEAGESLARLAEETDTQWGTSNVYRGLEQTHHFWGHARYALGRQQGRVTTFGRVAIDYMLKSRERVNLEWARHPLVLRVERDFPEASRELLDTLREYLLCERSVKRAAEKLYVHRNNVTYRIDQLKLLEMLDFDDAYERQYALISLML